MAEPPQGAFEAGADVAKSAIAGVAANPTCLALLLLSVVVMGLVYLTGRETRERQHSEMMQLYTQCFGQVGR